MVRQGSDTPLAFSLSQFTTSEIVIEISIGNNLQYTSSRSANIISQNVVLREVEYKISAKGSCNIMNSSRKMFLRGFIC